MRPRTWIPVVFALVAYALLWVGWRSGSAALAAFDDALLRPAAVYALGHPGWVIGWNLFCELFSPAVLRIALLVPIGALLLRRRWRAALFLVAAGEGSGLVDLLAKLLAGRSRPASALVPAFGSSFPSGHALGTLAIVLAVAVLVRPLLGRTGRAWFTGCGALFVVAIGVGRVVLLVHHPSDVLAGWALGYAVVVLCRPLLGRSPAPPPRKGPTRSAAAARIGG